MNRRVKNMASGTRRALLGGCHPAVPCFLPQRSREPPRGDLIEVEAGSVLARKLPTKATRFCRDPDKRGVAASGARDEGSASRAKGTCRLGRSRVWGQMDHLRGLALAEEGASSILWPVPGS